MSSNRVYWKNRDKLYKLILGVSNKEMAKQYKLSALRIKKDMEALYDKIMSEENPLASHLYKYQEYYEAINNLNAEMQKLGLNQEVVLDKRLTLMYEKNSKLVSNTFGLRGSIDTNAAKNAVRNIWCADGKSWSLRIWLDKALLELTIEQGLVDCVAAGLPKDRFVEELMHRFSVSYHNAERLVRTELSYIQNKSAVDRYEAAGCLYYEILSNLAEDFCLDKNGEKVPIQSMRTGDNCPPFHPNCRCTVLPVIE